MTILSCKQSLECISLQIFFKIIQFWNHGIAPTPPPPPNFESVYSTHGEGGRFEIVFAKMMNLKVPRAILPLGGAFPSTGAKTVWGVVATPLRRTRLNKIILITSLFVTLIKEGNEVKDETESKLFKTQWIYETAQSYTNKSAAIYKLHKLFCYFIAIKFLLL